jgi:hypothetical protein
MMTPITLYLSARAAADGRVREEDSDRPRADAVRQRRAAAVAAEAPRRARDVAGAMARATR